MDTPRLDAALRRLSIGIKLGLFPGREDAVVRFFGRRVEQSLEALRPDAVISINAAHKIVSMVGRWPVLHVADGLFDTIIDYYPKYSGVGARARAMGRRQDQQLMSEAHSILLTSEWAARSAVEAYGPADGRLKVAPIGASLDTEPERTGPRAAQGPLRLLFVGYDWRRKGGDLALAAFQQIRRRLPNAEFHIVGSAPRFAEALPGVVVHGVLSPNGAASRARLEDLFRGASMFFMPSRQEAYGLVYCEAGAFGLPVVATDTGGVGTIVRNGQDGVLLAPEAPADAYADAILELWADPDGYRDMQLSARSHFEERINWRAWGDTVDQELARIG